mmetsp:Transcript_57252/g.114886  ORF Transcript_57252/g.114886 Transcript_57252/m.114886 type:complete len:83 (-) Transcript_57252:109-357(-)
MAPLTFFNYIRSDSYPKRRGSVNNGCCGSSRALDYLLSPDLDHGDVARDTLWGEVARYEANNTDKNQGRESDLANTLKYLSI